MLDNKADKEDICELCCITTRSYFNWKKEKRPIVEFLEKYILKNDIQEFLKGELISRVELVNNVSLLTYEDMQMIIMLLDKVEMIVKNDKLNREGYLIKLYRTLRDLPAEHKDYIYFFRSYNMKTLDSLKNVIWGSTTEDIVKFYEEYLSYKEVEFMLHNKEKILPPLKAMRRYNAHLKD